MSSPWSELAFFESADLTSQAFLRRHERSRLRGQRLSDKSAEITAHVTQGRQYFEAAERAGELARPLHLYYGVLALSRALILFLRPNFREAALYEGHGVLIDNDSDSDHDASSERMSGGHGIETHDWSGLLTGSDSRSDAVAHLQLELLPRGTFAELCEATRNIRRSFVLVRHGGPYSGFHRDIPGTTKISARVRFQLHEFLARVPQLGASYFRTLGLAPACAQLRVDSEVHELDGCYFMEMQLYGTREWHPSREDALSITGLSPFDHRGETKHSASGQHHRFRIADSTEAGVCGQLPPLIELQAPFLPERRFYYSAAPLPGGVKFSQLSLFFLIAYALGMLVRYFPTHWARLSGRMSGDRTFPLFKQAIDVISTEFPRRALDELTAPAVPPKGFVEDPMTWID